MTDFDRIRREAEAELAGTDAAPDALESAEQVQFDVELHEILGEEGLSDEAIEWLVATAADVSIRPEVASNIVNRVLVSVSASIPDLKQARESRGISISRAREMLGGIAPAVFERLEQGAGLRWLGVGSQRVGAYLDELGISRGMFVRALTPEIRSHLGEQPWGYRPGAVADHPVASTGVEAVLRDASEWAAPLLSENAGPSPEPAESREVFGFSWSPAEIRRQARSLSRATRRAILREEMLSEGDLDWDALAGSTDRVLVLLTDQGRRFPAFQFDPESRNLRPMVAELNGLLRAGEDAWGAASWWFTPSAYLGERPVDALDAPDAQTRLRAALSFLDADPG
jgi:hypothetical protein